MSVTSTSFQIKSTKFTVNPDGTPGRITMILWDAIKTDQSVSGRISNRGTKIPDVYLPADKPYADITEEDCIAWVLDLEDMAGIDAQLDVAITKILAPTESSGVPWQDNFPLWAAGVAVEVGYVAIYQSVGYEVIQAHTTSAEWAPPLTPALWKPYVPPSEGPQTWVQPTGAQDAYPLGAQVLWDVPPAPEDPPGGITHLWTSVVDANVWEPLQSTPSLWTDEGPY